MMPETNPSNAVREFHRCFNAGRFHEAHDTLEGIWLARRGRPEADFFKGLIQLAAAFVHVQRGRQGPALVLLARAGGYLARAPGLPTVDVGAALGLAAAWQDRLTQRPMPGGTGRLLEEFPPHLAQI